MIPFPKMIAVTLITYYHYREYLWFNEAEGHGQRAKLRCRLISDSIFWLFYFTPTWLVGVTLGQESPKRIIQKIRQQQIRDKDVSFILSFIYWVQQPFPGWGSFSWIHWNGWIPHLRCQKYVNLFMHVFVLILVFRASIRVRFSFGSLSKSGKG